MTASVKRPALPLRPAVHAADANGSVGEEGLGMTDVVVVRVGLHLSGDGLVWLEDPPLKV